MSLEFQAQLDPAARKSNGTLESFQSYLRRERDYEIKRDGVISDKEYQDVEQLLRGMLAWEAKDRVTAKDALAMPFLE